MGCANCNSTKSFKGQKGDSAYDIWLSQGNSGTEADFLASLVGTNGTNGYFILSPNALNTPVSTTGTALEDLMAYTLINANTSPTPFEDGDILRIEGRFDSDGANNFKLINLLFDGTAILSGNLLFGVSLQKLTFEVNITRVSATTVYAETLVKWFTGNFAVDYVTTSTGSYSSLITVSDLDTVDVILKTQGDSVTAGDITENYLRVKLEKHV